jgi:diguanylate cyclase (GGDEF)-like protein
MRRPGKPTEEDMFDPTAIEALFRDSSDLVVLLAPTRRIRAANPAFLDSVADAREGVDFLDLVDGRERDRVSQELTRAAGGRTVLVEVRHPPAAGDPRPVEYRFFPVEGGLVAGIGRLRSDGVAVEQRLDRVSRELREKNRILDEIQLELTQVPFIDPVTGVWNRLQVIERLTGEWSRSERYGSPICCLLVDVEGLAEVRERHGVFVADEVLKAVARRLKRVVRDHDVVGRYGGDRFVIVAVSDGEGARSLAQRVLDAANGEPVAVGEKRFPLVLRVGGCTNRSEGVDILEDLFTVAESALHSARANTVGILVADDASV